jgi:hypothetical protein
MTTVRDLRGTDPERTVWVLRGFRLGFGVVGVVVRKPDGWFYQPQTAGLLGSRKAYPTAYQACRRYVREDDVVMTRAEAEAAGTLKRAVP